MSKFLIFPPKKLRKNTGAFNTHAPIFLKKKILSTLVEDFYFPTK